MPSLPPAVSALAARQAGVVGRRELLELGTGESELRSWLRHRLLVTRHPGVYVVHTGHLSREQEAWAAVLYAEPAALFGPSALLAHLGTSRQVRTALPVHVGVAAGRHLTAADGVVIHRVVDLEQRTLWHVGPPRMRVEEAALDTAVATDDDLAALAVLAEVVGSRRTTAARIDAALVRRPRIARRAVLAAALRDIEVGACSVLESAYLRRVEGPHGLPTAGRQVRCSRRGTVFRDVEYAAQGVVVELDGRADHTALVDRDRDLQRDLWAVEDGLLTVRLGHGQVLLRACATAETLGRVLRRRGWTGRTGRCPQCPPGVNDEVDRCR